MRWKGDEKTRDRLTGPLKYMESCHPTGSPHYFPGKLRRCLHIRFIRLSLVNALEFTLAVELTLVHRNTDLVRYRFHLLVGRVQHGSRAKVDNLADLILVESLDEIPYFRVYAESIIGISEKQNVYGFRDGSADRKRLCSDCIPNGLCESFCVSGFGIVSDGYFHDYILLIRYYSQ